MCKSKRLVGLLLMSTLIPFSVSVAGEAPSAEEQKKTQLFLQGVKLWPNYCGNCHNPLGPADRSPTDWELVMMHMRTRANIPPDAADAIVEYLKRR